MVLTIAGSDTSGGAGIQADLKTFQFFNVWGCSVITSLTAQNTLGVKEAIPVSSDFVFKQIEAVATDIQIDSVKIGMLYSGEIVKVVVNSIDRFKLKNIVLDTVLYSKNNKALLSKEGVEILKNELIPKSTVITPNIPEAEILTGIKIKNLDDIKKVAKSLKDLGAEYIVIKGGHRVFDNLVVDTVYDGKEFIFLKYPYIKLSKQPKGTGCTFSSAIAVGLAKGYSPLKSIYRAKAYINMAITNSLKIGSGYPVLNFNLSD